MSTVRTAFFATWLLLPVSAWAQDPPAPPVVGDAIYKGVVGKALDAVPMDPEQRIVLQRTNAVVSSTLSGRTLAVWAGLVNPIFFIGGLAWGLFSASNIKPKEAGPAPHATLAEAQAMHLRLETGLVFLDSRHTSLQPDPQW